MMAYVNGWMRYEDVVIALQCRFNTLKAKYGAKCFYTNKPNTVFLREDIDNALFQMICSFKQTLSLLRLLWAISELQSSSCRSSKDVNNFWWEYFQW